MKYFAFLVYIASDSRFNKLSNRIPFSENDSPMYFLVAYLTHFSASNTRAEEPFLLSS